MLVRLKVGSVYVVSAGSKVMRYIYNTRRYRLCWYAYKSALFMLVAPAVRLCGTYTRQYRLCWYAYKSALFMLAAPAVRYVHNIRQYRLSKISG